MAREVRGPLFFDGGFVVDCRLFVTYATGGKRRTAAMGTQGKSHRECPVVIGVDMAKSMT
jgi:hypothetical protein